MPHCLLLCTQRYFEKECMLKENNFLFWELSLSYQSGSQLTVGAIAFVDKHFLC